MCSCDSVVYAQVSGASDPDSMPIDTYFVFLVIIQSVYERDWSVQHVDKAIVNCLYTERESAVAELQKVATRRPQRSEGNRRHIT